MSERSPPEPDRTAVHAPAYTAFPAENLAAGPLSFPIALSRSRVQNRSSRAASVCSSLGLT
jgi:hypothetical protein